MQELIVALERDLDCIYLAEPIEGISLDIVKGQYEITSKDKSNLPNQYKKCVSGL